MVDTNLLLISALAVGGYYMWSTYSVEEAAEDLTNAVIDGALAVGGVVLERTGEMLEEVGDAVVEVATNDRKSYFTPSIFLPIVIWIFSRNCSNPRTNLSAFGNIKRRSKSNRII